MVLINGKEVYWFWESWLIASHLQILLSNESPLSRYYDSSAQLDISECNTNAHN